MRKETVVIGIIFALIGLGLMSGYGAATTQTMQKSIAYVQNQWSLECNLTGGDKVALIYQESAMWITHYPNGFIDSDDDPPVEILPVFIDITPISPAGNTTEWENDLAIWNPSTAAGGQIAQRLVGWRITLTNQTATPIDPSIWLQNGNLTVIGGTVPFSGLYDATVRTGMSEAPAYISFMHNVTTTDHPYGYLLPAGAATMVFGGTVLLLGARGAPVARRKHIKGQKHPAEKTK